MVKGKSNKDKYPEAWEFFIKHARNMEDEEEVILGKYRIPKPDQSGDFLYANCPGELFWTFKNWFYKVGINSPSVYGKIQYIVQNF